MANPNMVKQREIDSNANITRHSKAFIEKILNVEFKGTDSRMYESRDCTLRVSGIKANKGFNENSKIFKRYRSATIIDLRDSLGEDKSKFKRKLLKAIDDDLIRLITDREGNECIMINPYLYYDGVDANIPYATWLWCTGSTREALDVLKESCITGIIIDPVSGEELRLTTEDHLRYADFHEQLQSSENSVFIYIRAHFAKHKRFWGK